MLKRGTQLQELDYNIRYNITIKNMPDTINTIANKFRGATVQEIKQLKIEPEIHDLFVVLLGVYGSVRAGQLYFTDI